MNANKTSTPPQGGEGLSTDLQTLPKHPHSAHPHAPIKGWGADLLGDGFTAQTIPLGLDEDGEVVATIVRYTPVEDPHVGQEAPIPTCALLYLHGWNDYFFNPQMARELSKAGVAFFAIELRKYGRSIRPGTCYGYVEALSEYDEELGIALAIIREEMDAVFEAADVVTPNANFGRSKLPIVLMGHSTGGLIATLYAKHHEKEVDGLILNSPWLETAGSTWWRTIGTPIINVLSDYRDKYVIPLVDGDLYGYILRGWQESDGDIPAYLQEFKDDPSVAGWDVDTSWKQRPGAPIRAGWLRAISAGHNEIAEGTDFTIPILTLTSLSSCANGEKWSPKMRHQDVVLDTDMMVWRAAKLGRDVTINRFPAPHDLFLGEPPVREQVYSQVNKWLLSNGFITKT